MLVMNFVTVGTRQIDGVIEPNDSPELYAAVGASLIAESGLVLNKSCKLPKKIEDSLTHLMINKDIKNLESRFFKPISLHLSSDDPMLQAEALEIIRPRRIVSIDTNKKWIEKKTSHLSKLRDDVDVLFLNREEAMMLTGKKNPREAAKFLADDCIAVVKMGPEGVIVADDEIWQFPAFPVKVADDSCAGDAFAGAFTAYLSKRPSLLKAAVYANVVASFAVEGGIQKLLSLKRKDVRQRYKSYLRML